MAMSRPCPVQLCVDTFPKDVKQNPSEPRERRSQRDYSLPVKLTVVGEVGRGELSYQDLRTLSFFSPSGAAYWQ